MKLFKKLLAGIVCCAVPALLFSQDFSNKGKDFWIGYGNHVRMFIAGDPEKMQLYLTSDQNTTGNVEISSVGFNQNFSVTANQITTVDIPRSAALLDQGIYNHGIHVTSQKPVVVYSFIYVSSISGATVCLPTNTLGREYYSVNFKQLSNDPNSHSYFFVVAADTGTTTVAITPSATLKNGAPAGVPFTVTLKQGQIYQALGQVSVNQGVDLTGSKIQSLNTGAGCKRIGVFCGSGKISIGCNDPEVGSSDNLYQQIYPTAVWGKTYITVPPTNNGSNFQNNFYRIIRPDPSAIVTLNGVVIPSASFTNNFYYQFTSTSTNVISSNLPILVAQYFPTTEGRTSATNCNNSGIGDPEMIYLNPVEQTVTNVTLNSMQPAANTNITTHFLNVVLKNVPGAINSFRIDGTTYPSSFSPVIQDPSYAYARIGVPSQGHTVTCDSAFNIISYGFGTVESYGYSGGTNLKDLYQFVSILNQYATVNFPATCSNTPFFFRIVLPYQPTKIQWAFGSALNAQGMGDVTVTSPVFDSSWVVNNRTLYRYSLPLQYSIPAIGTYPIKIIVNNPTPDGCSGIQDIDYDLQVFKRPSAGFYFNTKGCVTSPVNFFDTSNTGGRAVTKWNWNFGDGGISSVQSPSHTYSTSGPFVSSLSVITDVGCISDTATRNVVLTQPPLAKFGASLPYCIGKAINFTDSSTVSGGSALAKWYWDFGDGSPVVMATTNASQMHSYTSAGTYNATLKVETTSGCQSVVFTRSITIDFLPQAGFITPEVCLIDPAAPFIDTSKIVSGGITAWQWNFGDQNANAGNPNTSTLQNPTHRYSVAQNYTAALIVTSSNGCADTITQTFSVNGSIPLANFTVQNANALCSNKDVTISDASSVDIGNIIKTEIYWDWINDPTIKTTDDVPSPGKLYTHTYPESGTPATRTYTIRMVSYSGISCLNVLTKTITVLATPILQFDALNEVCTNAPSFQITQASSTNGLSGSGVFSGPGVSSTGLFDPSTVGAGVNTIRYTFTSANSCSNFIEQTILVNPTPNANAGPDKTVLEGGVVQLTTALNAGFPVTYTWSPATGLNNPNAPNPLASPVDDIMYTLKVTSDKGCTTSDQVLVKVLKKPAIPNIFSPNGDGIHDKWVIEFLDSYPGCTVEIFNRYGQRIYYSVGYTNAWDGTINGKPVPIGTYYYIIDPKNGRQKQAGYVDIIR